MPYKVVQTVEAGKPTLTTVPHSWESDGILCWPKKKADKLRKQEDTSPNDSWFRMVCTVKRLGLPTFQSGEEEIFFMCSKTDTEEEIVVPQLCTNILSMPTETLSFNDVAEDCHVSSYARPNREGTPNVARYEILIDDSQKENDVVNQINLQPYEVAIENTCHCRLQELSSGIENKINEFQRVVLKRMAGVEAALEIINKKITRLDKNEHQEENYDHTKVQQIKSLEELQSFEDKIKLGENITALENKYISLCGSDKGINVAYRLIDILFSRPFLTQCSWSGGSRGDLPKLCFKFYQHTILYFFNVVNRLDRTFTLHEYNIFFKNILRYSKQRNLATGARMSAPKRRPKVTQLQQPPAQVDPAVALLAL